MLNYRPPSLDALQCRRELYTCTKLGDETTVDWFRRLTKLIGGCEFDTVADIMLIDKFLSGVDASIYSRIVAESTLDSSKVLLIALESESASETFIKVEVEIEDEHQETVSVWFGSDKIDSTFDYVDVGTKTEVHRTSQTHQDDISLPSRQKCDDFTMNDQKRLVCLKCMKTYATRKSFRRHYRIHTENSLPCPKCGTLFPTRPTLRRHMLKHETDHIRDFECYICRRNFRKMCGLQVHLGKEHKTEPTQHRCGFCDKTLYTAIGYEKHMAQHRINPLSYVCETCGKSFAKRDNWQSHLRTHNDARNYVCEHCGSSYIRKDHLNQHILVHSGERPFKCRFCPQAFRLQRTVKTHETIHTGERRFKCPHPMCGKAFARDPNYRRHLRVHDKIKPFPCAVCDKKFATKFHLQRHSSVHTGNKPYVCVCGARYTQSNSLATHKLKCIPSTSIEFKD